MDTGSIAKPGAGTPLTPPTRAEAPPSAGAVATELPPDAAVRQAGGPEVVRFEAGNGLQARAALDAAVRDVIKRRLEIDPKTREVVFQAVDRETGEVVRQVPEEAILKMRAYAREMRAADAADDGERAARVTRIA